MSRCRVSRLNSLLMGDQKHSIRNRQGNLVDIHLRRDKRLTRTSRWERQPDGSLLLRIPYHLPKHQVGSLLEQVANHSEVTLTRRSRHNDTSLQQRAEEINKKHFDGKIRWTAIRWVSNMQIRLGSCTRGGPTDGEIRISDRIKTWPCWVIDYVIAHELMHRLHPNHSAQFWDELKIAFPLMERARGFITGIGFAAGHPLDEDGV